MGSKSEAWLYVQEMSAYWAQYHALDWARTVLSSNEKPISAPPGQRSLM
jgi:hypothetical protein